MPSSKRLAQEKARDRRAKIMLAVLGVVLLAVVGFELPTLLGGSGSKTAVMTTAGTPTSAPAVLAPAQASSSQLASFSRFAGPKEPFHALAAATTATGTTASTTTGGKGSSGAKGATAPGKIPAPPVTLSIQPATKPATTTTQAGPLVPAAVLNMNGTKRVITVGASFPTKHPVFKLLAVGQKTMWLELVNGSLTSGSQTLVVHFGKPLKLVNQTAKLSYLLGFVKTTVAPPPPPAAKAPPQADTSTSAAATTTAETATVSAASP
jgi:hypothetical protein